MRDWVATERASQRLTRRETEVLRGLSRGVSNKGLARQLCVSPHTLRHHMTRIYAKLGVDKRWWVPGWLYQNEQQRADRWERLAWSLTNAAQKAVEALAATQDDKTGGKP